MPLSNAQNADSLKQQLSGAKTDMEKLKICLALCNGVWFENPDESLKYSREALLYAKRTGIDVHKCYLSIGQVLAGKGKYAEAMDNYLNALKILEKNDDVDKEKFMAKAYDGIGVLYVVQENFEKAIEYKNKALTIYKKIKDADGEATESVNLGNVYYYMKQFDRAIEAYNFSAKVFKELKDDKSVATVLNNIGGVYFEKEKYEKALDYFMQAYEIRAKTKDQEEIIVCLNNIGEANGKLKKTDVAIEYCLKAYNLAKKEKLNEMMYYSLENISSLYELKEDYKNSIYYHKLFAAIKDSIADEKNSKQFHELGVKYETEKKEVENKVLRSETERQKTINWSITGGLVLLTALAFFIFRSYTQKKKANLQLEEKNILIEEKNKIVEEQHKDITDSIKYAQRIQQAILPPAKFWQELLPNSFVLYKPKDILSGDFYWIEQNEENIYVAAADCTGHGVPGALMSLVNYNLLNKALLEKNLVRPADILDEVNKLLTVSLHQTYNESAVRDGMDIALCAIHKKSTNMQFAGAFNGGYIFKKDGSFLDLNGDKTPVGAFIEEKISLFTNNTLALESGDKVFIFSDGYADQFGGPKGKKLKYVNLKQYISESLHLDIEQQKNYLEQKFNEWRGNYEQVDDVLVIGFTI